MRPKAKKKQKKKPQSKAQILADAMNDDHEDWRSALEDSDQKIKNQDADAGHEFRERDLGDDYWDIPEESDRSGTPPVSPSQWYTPMILFTDE